MIQRLTWAVRIRTHPVRSAVPARWRIVSHNAAIRLYLGKRIGLAPIDEDVRLWTHQNQLTITDIGSSGMVLAG
jgi:hypothetical protein